VRACQGTGRAPSGAARGEGRSRGSGCAARARSGGVVVAAWRRGAPCGCWVHRGRRAQVVRPAPGPAWRRRGRWGAAAADRAIWASSRGSWGCRRSVATRSTRWSATARAAGRRQGWAQARARPRSRRRALRGRVAGTRTCSRAPWRPTVRALAARAGSGRGEAASQRGHAPNNTMARRQTRRRQSDDTIRCWAPVGNAMWFRRRTGSERRWRRRCGAQEAGGQWQRQCVARESACRGRSSGRREMASLADAMASTRLRFPPRHQGFTHFCSAPSACDPPIPPPAISATPSLAARCAMHPPDTSGFSVGHVWTCSTTPWTL
jgi:hypothetical protein